LNKLQKIKPKLDNHIDQLDELTTIPKVEGSKKSMAKETASKVKKVLNKAIKNKKAKKQVVKEESSSDSDSESEEKEQKIGAIM